MLDQICQLARDAGSLIMRFYGSEEHIKTSYKIDQTPITNVDLKSNNIIKKGLLSITPQLPIVSEEDAPDFKICRNWDKYWLIDPLDGTKEFLKKNGEFTVNISLIENGIPILGVIYAPFFNILYSAFKKEAWKEVRLGVKTKIHVRSLKIPSLIFSRSHFDIRLNDYLNSIKYYKVKKMGSSLKFCFVSEGKFQIYPRFGNTYIWDTGAGHAIIRGSGGKVETWSGEELSYSLSLRSSFINPGFRAFS